VLSAAGEALVGPARRALRDVETGVAAVAEVAGLAAGGLDLVALATLAVDPLATLVGRFRLAHPGVTIALADPRDGAHLVDLVATGACEVGLTVEAVPASGLLARELARQDLLAVLPPGTVTPTRALPVTRLAEHPIVAAPAGTPTRTQLEDAFSAAGLVPRIAVTTAQREAILPLVLAGAGATLFPRPLAEQAAALGAVVTPLSPRLSRPVFAIHRAGTLSPAAAAFLELAAG
jgi:DNA-binding transcriptional LysR family regulator